jgi:hypothetical protein
VNDTFRQAGVAVGVAALGALVPAGSALGGGSPQKYVDGLQNALLAGAGLAAVAAVAAGVLIGRSSVQHDAVALPAESAEVLAEAA